MTELERKALLPAGLRDVLPPFAAFEAEVIERLMARFAASGYARIKAPLVEFEDGLIFVREMFEGTSLEDEARGHLCCGEFRCSTCRELNGRYCAMCV